MKKFMFSMLMALIATAFVNGQGTPDTRDYLHFVSLKSGDTVRLNRNFTDATSVKLEYSTNRKNWYNYSWYGITGTSIAFFNVGDTVWFRAGENGIAGTNAIFSDNSNHFEFEFGTNDSIAAGGNIMSLYDGTCQQNTMTAYGFAYLFNGCKALTTAPSLPATQVSTSCYYSMFNGCSSLKTAPELPATELERDCYISMFYGCTSLITAPSLQATQLADGCYNSMFSGCTSLKIDTCDGSCAGALLTTPSQGADDWNRNMFKDFQGDSIYTAENGIKLGGRYCITGTAFNVNVNVNDTTMGSVAGAGIYACGDTVTLTATAKAGYKFVNWSTGETTATISFEMENHDTTLTATFALISGVEEIEVEKYVAYAEDGSIIVNGVAGCSVAIYDMNGRLVGKVEKANETERFAVGMSGVYVVTVDNKAEAKVVVK